MNYLLLLIGFVLLVKGADFFVDGSSSLAKRLKIPAIVIGLTIVAFGTSAPEAAVSISASLKGSNGIVIGNVVGSNLFNLLVVVGTCALIKPFKVERKVMNSEFSMSIYAGLLLLVVGLDTVLNGRVNVVDRTEGIFLTVFIILFCISQVKNALKGRNEALSDDSEEEIKLLSPLKTLVYIIGGMAAIIFGGDLVVDSASAIAKSFGVSDHLIGLTIVAIGTSLPELVTSVVAAIKGESDLALGNVIGSNIFNVFFILGLAGLICPFEITSFAVSDTVIFIVASVAFYALTMISKGVKRWHGAIYVLMYILFTAYIMIR